MRRSFIQAVQQHEGEEFKSVEVIEERAKCGEILEFDRGSFIHVALYIGRTIEDPDHYVLNVCAESRDTSTAPIRKMRLREVANNDGVRINNHDEIAKRLYGIKPRSCLRILYVVKEWNNTEVPYSFFQLNCEYYSTFWRFGKGFSTQSSLIMKSGINAPLVNTRKFWSSNKFWLLCACPLAPHPIIPILLGCQLLDFVEPFMVTAYRSTNEVVTHYYERGTTFAGPRWMLRLFKKVGFNYRTPTCGEKTRLLRALSTLLHLHPACRPEICEHKLILLILHLLD